MKRKLLFVFFSILFLGHAVNVHAAEVTATVTADNYYALFYGNEDGSTLSLLGSSLNVDWKYPDTYAFDIDENDYIYAAVWSDGAVAQGFIGQFVTEAGIMLTNTVTWEACSMGKPFTIESISSDISSASWSSINYSLEQQIGPWSAIAQISMDAKWIWPVPLQPGSSSGEYHLLRTKVVCYPPPIADAGEDKTISMSECASTAFLGTAMYVGEYPLKYRWLITQEGLLHDDLLLDWTPVGENNECYATNVQGLVFPGVYELVLQVTDGQYTSSDSMTLTVIEDSPSPAPIPDAGEDVFIYYDEQGSTTLLGMVIYEGDKPLQYRWTLGPYILLDWTPVGENNECFITGQDGAIPPGIYELTLEVTDGQQTSSDQMIITIDASPPPAPVADAGENISIYSEDVTGIIYGTATYTGDNPLQYRWLWEETILLDWTPAGSNNECTLVTNNTMIPPGTYVLTLEVSDGQSTSTDSMILTILNSAPHAAVLEGPGTYQVGSDVFLSSEASDFDGDTLTFSWKEGSAVISTGNVQSVAGGTPVLIPDCTVSGLDIGTHYLALEVSDGVNDTVIIDIIVDIVDTQVPTLAPVLSTGILWPPNHQMVDITIQANASDNSGLPVTLSAFVISNEPVEGLGDGDLFPDWTGLVIDQGTGIISFQLRAERSGTGDGREYTVIITATDTSGNSSSVEKIVIVPHDKSKK